MSETDAARKTNTYCSLCIARCGAIATIENGRLTALDPDPSHPTGLALCGKGRALPELIHHPDRLQFPMKRTRPKGDPDPGWQRITWEEALDLTAASMRGIADRHGPEAMALLVSSPSPTSLVDSIPWARRLMHAFGAPNVTNNLESCGWARGFATRYTWGVAGVHLGAAGAMADIANAGCLILWGYNPSMTRLTHATATVEALKRGMKLIVVDPRHAGLATKADIWLRVRPGSDGALALGISHIMISRGWFDRDFIRDWSNGPLLVRSDTGRFLRAGEADPGAPEGALMAWDNAAGAVVAYDPTTGRYARADADPALVGSYRVATPGGEVVCRPAFALYADLCGRYTPATVSETCWIDPGQVEQAAHMIWESRPVAYYAYAGHEQHGNATQTARAMSLLYALTGSFDRRGGNVLFPAVPSAPITGEDLPPARQMGPRIGQAERPLGLGRFGLITNNDLYDGILDRRPDPVRGLLAFGGNILAGRGNVMRGREALKSLEFFVCSELFMTPTAELADIVLPAAVSVEREALRIGFEVDEAAQSLVQLRQKLVEPPGEARSDVDMIFDLAVRLGLGGYFWNGDIEAAHQHHLGPSGLTLDALRAAPGGLRVSLRTVYEKYKQPDKTGTPAGFATPTRKAEIYSELFLSHGYAPLPDFVEPAASPARSPALAARFPLVLTSAKPGLFCDSQHRNLPHLRRRAPHPEVELHPDAAVPRGITAGDWVSIETPEGQVRARARFNTSLDPRVVVGQHGWWQACPELGLPGYDPFSSEGSNLNLLVGGQGLDPISGTPPARANVCNIRKVA